MMMTTLVSVVLVIVIQLLSSQCQLIDQFMPFQDFSFSTIEPNLLSEYDFVIIGSGSGGSVLANRLSENQNWTVLLLEAGGEETFLSEIPLMAAFQASTSLNWGYVAEKSDKYCLGLVDGKCRAARGKVLGGTSAINFLLYTRGNKKDFDNWSNLGNTGWSYEEVLPYFKRSEDCSGCQHIDRKYHGYDGNQHVENIRFRSPLVKKFLKAGIQLGYNVTDCNGRQNLGFSEAMSTSKNGKRYSANQAYLRPVQQRSNLHVVTRARVTKVLIDSNKRAFGVEYLKDRQRRQITASKEVILSAGAINSPHILMHSGVGPRKVLEAANVELLKELPSVGMNLQDHVSLSGLVFLVNESITISDTSVQNPRIVLDYVINGRGPYTIPGGALGLGFLKSIYANQKDDYPDIELVLGAGGLHGDVFGTLRNLVGIPDDLYNSVYAPVARRHGFGIAPVLLRPKSRGRISIRDNNPLHWPVIEPNYYQVEDDMKVMIEGVKMAIALTNTPSFKSINAQLLATPLPACQQSFGSDPYWECVLRQISSTLGHHAGTCRMGPVTDPQSVVDHRLRVHGVKALRVVDASVMPNVIAGHPNSVVLMIGEKASDMIKEDWSGR